MARIILDIPQPPVFKTTIDIRISDINYGQHVGHDTFVSLLHEARVRFFEHLGYTEANIEGKAILVADLAVDYQTPVFYPDCLDVYISVADFNKYGCDIFYRINRVEKDSLILEAKTGIVFFDYQNNKISHVPQSFMDKFHPDKS